MKSETVTLILVNLAGIMERADENLLPGVYKEVGVALHTDPTVLGSLTLFRSVVQSFCYPLAAFLAMRHNRCHVISAGAFLWAAATFLVGISSTFFQVAVSRGLSGIGLAIVIPAIQSLVADSTDDSNRGTAFGWLQLTGSLGAIIGSFCSVLIASTSVMGVPGWRIAFHLVGIVSVIVGILVGFFANDPHFSKRKDCAGDQILHNSFCSDVKELIQEAKSVMRIPSFQIIVAQGVYGTFSRTALSFAPIWLELTGFSHEKTSLLWTTLVIGASLGVLFGGRMGDILAKSLPNSGRIILSRISSGSAVPLAAVFLLVLPAVPSTAFVYGLVLFFLGFVSSWDAAATNNPIFAGIVPEKSRTTIYALDRSFETIRGSFAPALVGLFAQHVYGYIPIPIGPSNSFEIETDRDNSAALANALFTAIGIPMTICFFIYSTLYSTYPRDREKATMDALIEPLIQQLEAVPASCKIDISNEEEESLDLDINNEKSSLLSNQGE